MRIVCTVLKLLTTASRITCGPDVRRRTYRMQQQFSKAMWPRERLLRTKGQVLTCWRAHNTAPPVSSTTASHPSLRSNPTPPLLIFVQSVKTL